MVFRKDIQQHAESFLTRQLNNNNVQSYLTRPSIWPRFIDLLHVRVNEIDIMLGGRGINISKQQIERFVENATIAYADKQIEKRLENSSHA